MQFHLNPKLYHVICSFLKANDLTGKTVYEAYNAISFPADIAITDQEMEEILYFLRRNIKNSEIMKNCF